MPKILKGNSLTQNPEHRTQNPAEEKNIQKGAKKNEKGAKTKEKRGKLSCIIGSFLIAPFCRDQSNVFLFLIQQRFFSKCFTVCDVNVSRLVQSITFKFEIYILSE